MNCRNLWARRKPICFRLAEDQEKRANAAYACFRWIVNLCVFITVLAQLLDALCCADAQIIKSTKDNRFGWANFRARGNQSAFLSIVAERAFKSSASVGQRLRPPIDYAERARDNTISAAVANIVLHENRTDFSADDGAGWTCLEAAGFFAVSMPVTRTWVSDWR